MLTTKFHWSMPYIKVSKDEFDGSPPMLSSLPAALASPSRALYSIRFSRFISTPCTLITLNSSRLTSYHFQSRIG